MRRLGLIGAAILLGASACTTAAPSGTSPAASAGAPATQQPTVADIDLSGPVTLTLWHALTSDPQKKALEDAVAEFNRTNGKGITVNALVQGNYTQLFQKGLSAVNAGAMPELIHAYENQVADYMKADAIVDLAPYVSSPKNGLDKASRDDIYKPYYDTNTFAQYGNKLLSFPFTKSLFVMYQNDDLLKTAGLKTPTTWDEFEKAVVALTKKDAAGKTTQYGWAVALDASNFDAWVFSRGGSLLAADGKTVSWGGKEGLDTLTLIDRLVKGGYAYVPKGFDYQNDFAAGKLGFFMGSTSTRPFITAAIKAPATLSWSVAQIPQTNPANAKTVMYGANIAVTKSTPEKQLASWLFVKWFTDKEQSAKFSQTSFYMPIRKTSGDSATLKDYWAKSDPQGKQAFDLIGQSAPEPNVRGWQDVRDTIFDALTKVTTGTATPADALKAAADKANAILKENQ